MTINSSPVNPRRFFRQSAEPSNAVDGSTWVHPSDGAGNDTTSRYVFNQNTDAWELDSAVGPSTPTDGTLVSGATWRDTENGNAKQYDGAAFVNLGVTDHANLTNVTGSQHHSVPGSKEQVAYVYEGSASSGTQYSDSRNTTRAIVGVGDEVSFQNTGDVEVTIDQFGVVDEWGALQQEYPNLTVLPGETETYTRTEINYATGFAYDVTANGAGTLEVEALVLIQLPGAP